MATDRLACTVDGCGWFYDDDGPGPIESWPKLPAVGLTDYIRQATRWHLQRVENIIAAHLATHTPIEYLRTIQRLSQRVAELETTRSDESTIVDSPTGSV